MPGIYRGGFGSKSSSSGSVEYSGVLCPAVDGARGSHESTRLRACDIETLICAWRASSLLISTGGVAIVDRRALFTQENVIMVRKSRYVSLLGQSMTMM